LGTYQKQRQASEGPGRDRRNNHLGPGARRVRSCSVVVITGVHLKRSRKKTNDFSIVNTGSQVLEGGGVEWGGSGRKDGIQV